MTGLLERFTGFDTSRVPSPCFLVDEAALEQNLRLLARVQQESGAKILLALKAFSMFSLAPLVSRYLSGTCASGLHEAQLGREEFGGEVHTFSAAFTREDLLQILAISDHVVFNSCDQLDRFEPEIRAALAARPGLEIGLRLNPEHSEGAVPLYDPCAPCSRLGVVHSELRDSSLEHVSGLHFHTLCEQDFPPLERTVRAFEARFADLIPRMKWINFGGGHHITRPGYQIDALIALLRDFQSRWGVQVYLEPGEAIAYHCGVMVAEVLDITHNGMAQAILDTSATCHMPDVIEMPYRPVITGAGDPGEFVHTYRLGGQTCLAGDVIGDWSFPEPLRVGSRIVFEDMAYYTMVKTTTFNGINLPSIAIWNSDSDALRVVRRFGYEDFRNRLS
jgi:carboxynorspermidine decarboxylase